MKGLWLVTLSLVLAACSSAPEKPKPTSLTKLATPLEMRVVERLRLGGDRDLNGLAPAVDQAVIAAAGSEGRVVLVNSGLTATWDVNLKTGVIGGVGIGPNAVFLVTLDGQLVGLSRADGSEVLRVSLPSASNVAPVANDALVFVKTHSGQVMAFDATTGDLVWFEEVAEAMMGIQGGAPMVLENGILHILWESGRLVSYEAASGRIIWERQVALPRGRNPVSRIVDSKGAPSLRNGLIATASRNSQVSVLDAQSGQLLWSAEANAYPGAVLAFNAVIAVETDGTVVAYSAQTGETLWAQTGLKFRELSPPAVADTAIAVVDLEGYVHLLNPADGALLGRVRVSSAKGQVAPVMTAGGLLIQTVDGTLSLVEWPR